MHLVEKHEAAKGASTFIKTITEIFYSIRISWVTFAKVAHHEHSEHFTFLGLEKNVDHGIIIWKSLVKSLALFKAFHMDTESKASEKM